MIVAITGGTGFVGAGVVKAHLSRGDEVRVLTRRNSISFPGAHLIAGDLARGAIPGAFVEGVDVLYHCAGELRDVTHMHAVHVDGTRALIRLASGCIRRWVQLSSVGVYGPRHDGVVTEDTVENPVGDYEVTKAASDHLAMEAGRRGDLDVVIVRPSNIFGPRMPNQSLFGLIAAVDRGFFFYIGPPGASANYIPVENVVDALMLCATSPLAPGEIFNLSAFTTMEDFVRIVARALGRVPPKLRLPRAPVRMAATLLDVLPRWPLSVSRVDALSGRAVYSTERIESKLGFRHRVSVQDAMLQTVAQWRAEQAAR